MREQYQRAATRRPQDVAAIERVPPGTALVVSDTVQAVALFNVAGRLFGLDDACLRCGGSLAAGTMAGMLVACAGCGWRYDIASGQVSLLA